MFTLPHWGRSIPDDVIEKADVLLQSRVIGGRKGTNQGVCENDATDNVIGERALVSGTLFISF